MFYYNIDVLCRQLFFAFLPYFVQLFFHIFYVGFFYVSFFGSSIFFRQSLGTLLVVPRYSLVALQYSFDNPSILFQSSFGSFLPISSWKNFCLAAFFFIFACCNIRKSRELSDKRNKAFCFVRIWKGIRPESHLAKRGKRPKGIPESSAVCSLGIPRRFRIGKEDWQWDPS